MTVEPADGTGAVVDPREAEAAARRVGGDRETAGRARGDVDAEADWASAKALPGARRSWSRSRPTARPSLATAALASAEVSATTTSDSFSFEQPPATPRARRATGRLRTEQSAPKGCPQGPPIRERRAHGSTAYRSKRRRDQGQFPGSPALPPPTSTACTFRRTDHAKTGTPRRRPEFPLCEDRESPLSSGSGRPCTGLPSECRGSSPGAR